MQANLIRYDYDKLTLIGLLAQRFRVDYHRTGYFAVVWRQEIPELMRGLGKGVKSFKEGVNEAKDEINKAKEEVDKPADK